MSVLIAQKGKRSRKCFVGIKPEFQQFMPLTVEIQPYLIKQPQHFLDLRPLQAIRSFN